MWRDFKSFWPMITVRLLVHDMKDCLHHSRPIDSLDCCIIAEFLCGGGGGGGVGDVRQIRQVPRNWLGTFQNGRPGRSLATSPHLSSQSQ